MSDILSVDIPLIIYKHLFNEILVYLLDGKLYGNQSS